MKLKITIYKFSLRIKFTWVYSLGIPVVWSQSYFPLNSKNNLLQTTVLVLYIHTPTILYHSSTFCAHENSFHSKLIHNEFAFPWSHEIFITGTIFSTHHMLSCNVLFYSICVWSYMLHEGRKHIHVGNFKELCLGDGWRQCSPDFNVSLNPELANLRHHSKCHHNYITILSPGLILVGYKENANWVFLSTSLF